MADILDELLNDEKDEKRLDVFRKLFPVIIVGTIIIAICIAGYSWFLSSKTRNNQELGDSFVQLVTGGYKDEKLIDSLLQEINIGQENKISDLAALKLVSREIQNNNYLIAMQSLEDIINSKNSSDITTSYARVLYVSLVLDIDKLNQNQEDRSREYLQYFRKDTQVFYLTATLLKSFFYLKNGQFDLAKQYTDEILQSPRASAVIKEQAKALVAQMNYDKTK